MINFSVLLSTIGLAYANPVTVSVPIEVSGYTCTPSGTSTISCVLSGGGTAPTGCVATADKTTLPSSGGAVALAVASCSPAPTVYTWYRSGSVVSNSPVWNDSLPANVSGTPISYGYQVQACNGSACATFPSVPLGVTVASGGSAGCVGFNKTINMTINWFAPTRQLTANHGGFGPNDAVVVAFTSGGISTPNNNLARIAAAEYGTSPSTRIATLSPTPCDFGLQPKAGGYVSGSTVFIPFAVGSGYDFGYYPTVPLNTTYYFNIKNAPNTACTASGFCDILVELALPGGVGAGLRTSTQAILNASDGAIMTAIKAQADAMKKMRTVVDKQMEAARKDEKAKAAKAKKAAK